MVSTVLRTDVTSPRRVSGLCGSFSKVQHRGGDISGVLPFPRSLAGTGKSLLNPCVPSFPWTGPVFACFEFGFFLFMPLLLSHLSIAPCHSYHLGGVLLCQRIHTINQRKEGYKIKSLWEWAETPYSKNFHFLCFLRKSELCGYYLSDSPN